MSSQWTTSERRTGPAIQTVWAGVVLCATLAIGACWVAFVVRPPTLPTAPSRPVATFDAGSSGVTISRGAPSDFAPAWCDQTDMQDDGTVICWHVDG
jgi:hypothetical protein